jgi:hypothetical protein
LNYTFQEACDAWSQQQRETAGYDNDIETELLAVKAEIESLWDEVVPVAHMAVEKQLMEPILKRINGRQNAGVTQQRVTFAYVCVSFYSYYSALLKQLTCLRLVHVFAF